MNETVKNFVTTVGEVRTKLTELLIKDGGIEDMTIEDLAGMQMIFKLLGGVCDVVVEQAEIIEELKSRLDSIQR